MDKDLAIIKKQLQNTHNMESQLELFQKDTLELGKLAAEFITEFFPAYACDNQAAIDTPQENSLDLLNSFTFYKIGECKFYNVEDPFEFFTSKMQKLFTTAYSINQEVCYGLVSNGGVVSLVLGIGPATPDNDMVIPTIMGGLLPGIKLEKYATKFVNQTDASTQQDKDRYVGCVVGTPALKIDGELQRKDLTSLMRSLNGLDYTIMVMCKPVSPMEIQNRISLATSIKDKCFAISKRTISYQNGISVGDTHTEQESVSDSSSIQNSKGSSTGGNVSGALLGAAAGFKIGAIAGTPVPIIGNAVGAGAGALVGLIVGSQLTFNHSRTKNKTVGESHSLTKGYSDAITNTINSNKSISGEIQNSFAVELMEMADLAIQRLKSGRGIGMWKSVTSFSSDSEIASKIIQGCLYSEIASGIPEVLPPVVFSYTDSCTQKGRPSGKIHNQQLMIPKDFFANNQNCTSPLCSLVTSEELCAICTIPVDNTVGFEVHCQRPYALNYNLLSNDHPLGVVCEYDRPLPNIPFGLSDSDLNKHTLVCGITGCGKTNTVKKILTSVDKPFLVIEPAKKEYRNIEKENVTVYTLGRPEINCLRLNPFYVPLGISPQQHIDLLKDLFSASFAFYGPMPYILERCLNNIYAKKGWNLTLGFHPYLTNSSNLQDLFDAEKIKNFYAMKAQPYLFPTMQDLKDEIDYYITHEMTYEGEVKGNIQGAIKARIDSLCIGAKGYMFNTNEFTDFSDLLQHNSVLELEGLSDDADKAFALGLLIIYINEYRQVYKELDNSSEPELKHLLVIEEAHRLLKNVSTEKNEDMGNPKGKAVEHFTNMLAEMRSYGQGVIIAEQIPSKLAPEVIKNSSNKIIHRIVAQDDQDAIANTIGVYPEDAIYLGNSKVGYALCHKEGMIQPVIVKIERAGCNNILDVNLYNRDLANKMYKISKSVVQSHLSKDISAWALKVLNSLMYMNNALAVFNGINSGYEDIASMLTYKGINLIPGVDKKSCILSCIADAVISFLVAGVYSNHRLPNDKLVELLISTIVDGPTEERLSHLQFELEVFYGKKPEKRAAEIVAALVSKEYAAGNEIDNIVYEFITIKSPDFCNTVKSYLKKG